MLKRLLAIYLGVIFFPLIAYCDEALGAHHHYFAIEGDFVLLRRANSHNTHLVKAAGGPLTIPIPLTPSKCAKEPGKTLLKSNKLINDMNFDPAVRLSLKVFYGIDSTWDLRYLGHFTWKGKKSVSCPENLRLPGSIWRDTNDYNFADRAFAIYYSDLYTIDLNYWRHITPRYSSPFSVSWTVGLRFIDIDEKLKLSFTKGNNTSHYRVTTEDRAFGLQIGGALEYNPYNFFTWGIAGRVGGLFNRAKQDTIMTDNNNTTIVKKFDPSGSNFAYMAEFWPFIEIRPTKHFTFRISYEVFYVGDIALADQQFDFSKSKSNINHNGHAIYHGLFAGIQFNF